MADRTQAALSLVAHHALVYDEKMPLNVALSRRYAVYLRLFIEAHEVISEGCFDRRIPWDVTDGLTWHVAQLVETARDVLPGESCQIPIQGVCDGYASDIAVITVSRASGELVFTSKFVDEEEYEYWEYSDSVDALKRMCDLLRKLAAM